MYKVVEFYAPCKEGLGSESKLHDANAERIISNHTYNRETGVMPCISPKLNLTS